MQRHLSKIRTKKLSAPTEALPQIPFSQRFKGKISHVSRSGLQDILATSGSNLNKQLDHKLERPAFRENGTMHIPSKKRSLTEKTIYNDNKQNCGSIKNVVKSGRQSMQGSLCKLPPISWKQGRQKEATARKGQTKCMIIIVEK